MALGAALLLVLALDAKAAANAVYLKLVTATKVSRASTSKSHRCNARAAYRRFIVRWSSVGMGPTSASHPRLRPRRLHADAGFAEGRKVRLHDNGAGEADQDGHKDHKERGPPSDGVSRRQIDQTRSSSGLAGSIHRRIRAGTLFLLPSSATEDSQLGNPRSTSACIDAKGIGRSRSLFYADAS